MKRLLTFLISASICLLFTTCTKNNIIADGENKFGTVFGSGGAQTLNGVLKTKENDYILYGTTNYQTHGGNDGYILKVDENFKVIWYKKYGAERDESFNSLAIDDEGNMLAAGVSNSFGPSLDTTLEVNSLIYFTYISKEGEMLWEQTTQPNSIQSNRNSTVSTVLYLPNNTFAIVGSTSNYTQPMGTGGFIAYTKDAYMFGVDKQANMIWNGRFYRLPPSLNYAEVDEDAINAIISESGNIIFQMHGEKNALSTSRYYVVNLNKIPVSGPTKAINGQIWRGAEMGCIGKRTISPWPFSNKIAMAKTSGDGIVMYDFTNKGLIFSDNNGNVSKSVLFGKDIYVGEISNEGDKLILTTCGYYIGSKNPEVKINKPGWMVTDLNGNILEENQINITGDLNNVDFEKVFFSNHNEVLAFGTITDESGTNIIMLRFDHKGNLKN